MLALMLMTGCGTNAGGLNGDFGRVRPSLRSDDMHAWLGPAAARPVSNPPWHHQLTDEERRLRDFAYPLIEPPYNRNQWYSVISEYGLSSRPWPYPDRAAYASRLFQTPYRSQTARYGRLIEDIRNDVSRLDPFFASARIVSDMDKKRDRSLAYVSGLTQEEHANTVNRIRENEAIVLWVRESVRERVESYRIALERLVIAAPSPMAVEAERALALLQQRAA
jgi:hypothetical protein